MNWQENRKKEIEILLGIIERKLSITKTDLISKNRKKPVVMARRMFMNVLFEVFEKDKKSHGDISTIIERDRTSFIHHKIKHENEYSRYKGYKQEYDSLKSEFISALQ